MSEHDEPSYYEVALTSRQVMVAFLLLLGCLLAAFFAGLWIGRDSVSPPPPQTAAVESASQEEDPLEQFSFFEPENEGSDGTTTAPPPRRIEPPPPPPTELDPEPTPERSEPETSAPRQAAPATTPAVTTPAVTPPPPAEPPATLPRTTAQRQPPPPTGDELFIQVFSSPDQEQAQKVRRRLNDNGYSAFLSPVEVDDRTMYRVRIGPFIDRADAERIADRVKVTFRLDTWITSSQ